MHNCSGQAIASGTLAVDQYLREMKMTPNALTALMMFLGFTATAQSSVKALGGASDAAQRVFDNRIQQPQDSVMDVGAVEQPPEFPGGHGAMIQYLQRNTHYPHDAVMNNVQGKVFVGFVVRKDGSVDEVKVVRGAAPALDAEALRVVRAMPAWKPGRTGGTPVAVRYTLPIVFAMESPSPDAPPDSTR